LSELTGITTVSLDGDDTLWDFQKLMRHSLRHALTELRRALPGERAARLTIGRMIDIREEAAEKMKDAEPNLLAMRLQAFRQTLAHVGCDDEELAHRLNDVYLQHRFAGIKLYPDVGPALDALGEQFRIGLVSNGNTYPEQCGLDGRFAFVMFADDCGCAKPDPRIFHAAFEQAGCSPEEVLHVGDSLPCDVLGARNAGVRSVWLNRRGIENTADIEPDFEIASLTELVGLLGAHKP